MIYRINAPFLSPLNVHYTRTIEIPMVRFCRPWFSVRVSSASSAALLEQVAKGWNKALWNNYHLVICYIVIEKWPFYGLSSCSHSTCLELEHPFRIRSSNSSCWDVSATCFFLAFLQSQFSLSHSNPSNSPWKLARIWSLSNPHFPRFKEYN